MRGCRCSMVMGFTKPIEHSTLLTKEGDFMNPLYVGIDVSSKNNVAFLMLLNGDKHSNFPIINSHDGSVQLVKRIFSALTTHSLDTVLIGLEATSVYSDNLVYFLREDATLAPFDRKIHVLNPKQVKKFKDTRSATVSILAPNSLALFVFLAIVPSIISLKPQRRYML